MSTCEFRFSSGKPISLRVASLASVLGPVLPTDAPNTRDCLFTRTGDGGAANSVLRSGEVGGDTRAALDRGNVEDAARRPKPNRLLGFGGSGGGCSSELLVLPVYCCTIGLAAPLTKAFCSYFCRMNFSIAESTSSTSKGIGGLVL